MRVIGRAGVGVDNINVPEATKHGIMVMNTPGGNTVSTAQLALSLLCSMARKLPAADMSVKAGKWDRKSFMGVEMSGKTIGIVGCGRIGQVVASCANTMGMHVIGYDPIMAADELAELGIKKVDLSGIWSGSDFITLHTPLTPETTNLLNDTTIASCKDGVMIVNCARGGIVDESALLRGLESGKVAGAALDVYTSEPPKEDLKPLLSHPNLVCTPHLGASTDEAQINVARDVAQQMCDVFDQKDYYGVMNVGYMSASSSPNMAPFMRLAEIIGIFHAQLSTSKVSTVVLRTWGGRDVDITTNMARQLLMAKVLKGVIRHMGLGMSPDIISAPLMAKEVGIVSTISEEMPMKVKLGSPYWNKVSVQVTREDGTSNTIGGVVFGSTPHIVRVDDFADLFAFKPEGSYILSFRNEDRPGAISEVLDILHNVNVNVAGLNVSRQGSVSPQGQALCFMSLDDDIPDKAMTTLHSLSTLSNVAKIELR
eukprot:CAMPEP_0182421296 /NCGR_PEP_ID=MMETSP1167-20130531/6624_1 /TAXON_ID=2988 /ORGANISM="Mallomonas Sp, Strain CCMP3275" /LENGTH=482 /DNA_ID=CAMNT_0024598285 /DNA_START=303 /DNA_END=1751 /DNA_ORIENTATION=-